MSIGKVVIKHSTMDEDMSQYAIMEASDAISVLFNDKTSNSELAEFIRKKFKSNYFKSNWHCIVGQSFGALVTHETGRYIYFFIGKKGFLIWSTPL